MMNFADILKRAGSEVVEFFAHYFGGKAIDKAVDGVVDTVVAKPLKSKFGGFGTNDETLAFHAYAIASTKLGAKPAGLKRVGNVFNSLTVEERKKVIKIIGNREDTLTEKTTVTKKGKKATVPQGATQKPTTSNDEVTVNEKSETRNIKGAEILLALSKLKTEDEIRIILKSFGALDTTSVYIKEIWNQGEKATQIVLEKANSALKKVGDVIGKIEDKTGTVSLLNDLAGDINKKHFNDVPQPGQPAAPPALNVGKWQSMKIFFKKTQDKLLDTLY